MENNKMISSAKIIGAIIGLLTIAWQIMQIVNGKAFNMFLIADFILGIALILAAISKVKKNQPLYLLMAFMFSAGVFATATFGGLMTNTYNFGAITTTLALIPCVIYSVLLAKYLVTKLL